MALSIDAQPLLPLVVGRANLQYLKRYSRTKGTAQSQSDVLDHLARESPLTFPLAVLAEVDCFLTAEKTLRPAAVAAMFELFGRSTAYAVALERAAALEQWVVAELAWPTPAFFLRPRTAPRLHNRLAAGGRNPPPRRRSR